MIPTKTKSLGTSDSLHCSWLVIAVLDLAFNAAANLATLLKEALGSTRRHAITTQGYKEDIKLETSSLSAVQRARRVNKVGTTESRITDDVKNGLTSWSSKLSEEEP